MPSFIDKGLTWFQKERQLHCTEDVLIGTTLGTAIPLKATKTSDDGQSTQNHLTLQKQIFHFVVRRSDLVANNIKLHRGIKIWHDDDQYELSYESKDIYEYNDPLKLDIVLKAVLVDDDNPIHPTYGT